MKREWLTNRKRKFGCWAAIVYPLLDAYNVRSLPEATTCGANGEGMDARRKFGRHGNPALARGELCLVLRPEQSCKIEVGFAMAVKDMLRGRPIPNSRLFVAGS